MSGPVIEKAIRLLPPEEARALATLLQDLAVKITGPPGLERSNGMRLSFEALSQKYRVKDRWPAGLTTDEYLKIIRGGDHDSQFSPSRCPAG